MKGYIEHIIDLNAKIEEELRLQSLNESEFSDDLFDDEDYFNDSSIASNSDFESEYNNDINDLFEDSNNIEFAGLNKTKNIDVFDNSEYIEENIFSPYSKTPLFEHRGKPDPEKVRQRQEAHKRGLERHKNALERAKQAEAKKSLKSRIKQAKVDIQKQEEQKEQEENKQQNKKQSQQTLKDRIQQAKVDIQKQEEQKEQEENKQQRKKESQQKLNDSKKLGAQLNKSFSDMKKSAPNKNCEKKVDELNKDIAKLNSQSIDAFDKLTPAEKKRRREKAKEELEKKYDELEKKHLKDFDTPEEKRWFRKNFNKLKRVGVGTADNLCDLMGYKDVYTDVANAVKYILGNK